MSLRAAQGEEVTQASGVKRGEGPVRLQQG